MNFWKPMTAAALFSLAVLACSGEDESAKAGNNEACGEGQTCVNKCDAEPSSCNMSCAANAICKATCREGQECAFACAGTADCDFDCTAGSCTTSGSSATCKCTGNCVGTCGGVTVPDGGSGGTAGTGGTAGSGGSSAGGEGGGGEDCILECGSPTDPGYADCVAACAG